MITNTVRFKRIAKRLQTVREAYRTARAGFGGTQEFSTKIEFKEGEKRPYIAKGVFLNGTWSDRSFADLDRFEKYMTGVLDSYATPEDAAAAYKLDWRLSRAFGPWLSQIYVWHEIGKPARFEHRNLLSGVGRERYDGVRTSRLYDTIEDLETAVAYICTLPPETWKERWVTEKRTFDPNLSVAEMKLVAYPPKRKPVIGTYGLVIEMKNKDGSWSELYGHACYTEQDALKYCLTLGSDTFRVKYEEAA